MAGQWNYKGIIPAVALPLKSDFSIDEPDLRRLAQWLTSFKGIVALMTNGHTGEVFSLTPEERAEVTRINPLKDIVYGMGEPTGDAHARMKLAMAMAGRLRSSVVRPPTQQPDDKTRQEIARVLKDAGLLQKAAA